MENDIMTFSPHRCNVARTYIYYPLCRDWVTPADIMIIRSERTTKRLTLVVNTWTGHNREDSSCNLRISEPRMAKQFAIHIDSRSVFVSICRAHYNHKCHFVESGAYGYREDVLLCWLSNVQWVTKQLGIVLFGLLFIV